VLTRDTGFDRPYDRDQFATYADAIDDGRFAFPVGDAALDSRLRASALVVGVAVGEMMRAYLVEGLIDPINDLVSGTPVVVLPTTTGAAVFSPQVDDATLVLERHAEGFTDTETGSIWTGAGLTVAGPLEGTALEPLAARTTFWFALIGAFPEIEIYE
jgi:hypothetical protein